MPTGMQGLDLAFPDAGDGKSTEDKLTEILDYLYILMENLKYMLSNLGVQNFNQTELESMTAPVFKTIGGLEDSLLEIRATAEGASVTARDAQGSAAQAQLTAEGASLVASNAAGQAASLAFTVDGLSIEGKGKTTINGSKLTSKDTLNMVVEIDNGAVSLKNGNALVGRLVPSSTLGMFIEASPGKYVYLTGNVLIGLYGSTEIVGNTVTLRSDTTLRMMSEAGMSISAGNYDTLYLGTYNGGCNVDIGYEGKDVRLYGNVYINGVLQG